MCGSSNVVAMMTVVPWCGLAVMHAAHVCRCGFAQRQAPYEEAFHELFNALDKV